jgi:hypothetical protein
MMYSSQPAVTLFLVAAAMMTDPPLAGRRRRANLARRVIQRIE